MSILMCLSRSWSAHDSVHHVGLSERCSVSAEAGGTDSVSTASIGECCAGEE